MEIVLALRDRRPDRIGNLADPASAHFQVIIGLSLLSYAVNLFIYAMGRLRVDAPPIVQAGATIDPSQLPIRFRRLWSSRPS